MAVALGSIHTGGGTATSSPTVTNVTGGSDMLYLCCIGLRAAADDVSAVSGGGLTWAELDDQPSGRGQLSGEFWWAYGTPSSNPFTVTATISDATGTRTMHVVRMTGAKNIAPTVASQNTNGANGAGSGGTDNDLPVVTVSVAEVGSVVVNFMVGRNNLTPITYDTDYDDVAPTFSSQGSLGETISVATAHRTTVGTGNDTIQHDLSSNTDWVMFGAEIIAAATDLTIILAAPATTTFNGNTHAASSTAVIANPATTTFAGNSHVASMLMSVAKGVATFAGNVVAAFSSSSPSSGLVSFAGKLVTLPGVVAQAAGNEFLYWRRRRRFEHRR